MSADKTISYIHPKDFLETATPINDIINGVEMVWLVDFSLQIASMIQLAMYERRDWMGSGAPNQKMFTAFLTAQQSKIEKKTKTLQEFLNDSIELVPLYNNSDCTTFTVGFLVDKIEYDICSKTFSATSKIEDFLNELGKTVSRKSELVQILNIKLNPDKVSVLQMALYPTSQWQAATSWAGVKLAAVGYSPEEARAELDRAFQEMVVNLADPSFKLFKNLESVKEQEVTLDYSKIKVVECQTEQDCAKFGAYIAEYKCESFLLRAAGNRPDEARYNLLVLYQRSANALSQLQGVEITLPLQSPIIKRTEALNRNFPFLDSYSVQC